MPGWLRGLSIVNPLNYEVDALRGLLLNTRSILLLDGGVLIVALVAGVTTAAALLGRLARGWRAGVLLPGNRTTALVDLLNRPVTSR